MKWLMESCKIHPRNCPDCSDGWSPAKRTRFSLSMHGYFIHFTSWVYTSGTGLILYTYINIRRYKAEVSMAGGPETRSCSPRRWWNAGRANRGRPACASFPCIPYPHSAPFQLVRLRTPHGCCRLPHLFWPLVRSAVLQVPLSHSALFLFFFVFFILRHCAKEAPSTNPATRALPTASPTS